MNYSLKLHRQQYDSRGITLGRKHFLTVLGESDWCDLSFHNDFLEAARGIHGTIIHFEGKRIYLDLWEYPSPTHSLEVFKADFDLIIKVQHKDLSIEKYSEICNQKQLIPVSDADRLKFLKKIVPWTFFPSRMSNLFSAKGGALVGIKHDCFFCGRYWKCRHAMLRSLEKQGIECVRSNLSNTSALPLPDELFLLKMMQSKYGLVLAGRSSPLTDAKNRREIDYLMMEKPLLLNYKPYYYNPLLPGVHYIYIDEKTNIKNLENMYNIEEIAANGHKWYLENASKQGIQSTFLQIMKERQMTKD